MTVRVPPQETFNHAELAAFLLEAGLPPNITDRPDKSVWTRDEVIDVCGRYGVEVEAAREGGDEAPRRGRGRA